MLQAQDASIFIDELMAKMTLEEKIGQLNLLTPGGTVTGAVVSENVENKIKNGQVGGIFGTRGAAKLKKVQQIAVEHSRLKIPLLIGLDVIHGHQTVFPIPLAISCSWNMDLIEQSAQIAATEATAEGIMWTFSPMVDIARDPRWGRIAEGAGEDPFLGAEIAKAMVRGYQGTDLTAPNTMLACVKHFASYGAAEGGRDYGTVDMSKVRLYNEYLPPYKAAVEEGVGSIMTAFNVLDYVPASGNRELFTEILREQWGFDGMVVTDYTAVDEMIDHGMGNLQDVSALAIKAGIDMDMISEGYLNTLKESVEQGRVDVKYVDQACRNILKAKYDLGLFDNPYKYQDETREATDIMSDKHLNFARRLASETMVLLKNDKEVLPLSNDKKVALIGPLADSRRNMLGTWSVSGNFDKGVTLREAFAAVLPTDHLFYAKGANISDDTTFARKVNAFGPEIVIDERNPEALLEEAMEAANKSDVIVVAVGEAADMSGESSSMAHIGLQPAQQRLLKALRKLEKPIVMLLYNGRPMTLTWEDAHMDAILDVWFGGTVGAHAVADVVFGAVNPSGKLTASFPVHVGQIPVYHSMLNTGRPYNGEHNAKFLSNYLDIPNEPLYPFGYGLSYTSFDYSVPLLSDTILTDEQPIQAQVRITNTGKKGGAEVVQLYIRDVVGSISRPLKELKGFEKVRLEVGQSKMVSFEIDAELLKFYNQSLEYVAEPGTFELMVGPNSKEVQKITFEYQP